MQFVAVFAVADDTSEKHVMTGTMDSDKRVKEEMWTKQYFWKHWEKKNLKKKKKKEKGNDLVWCSLWFVLVTMYLFGCCVSTSTIAWLIHEFMCIAFISGTYMKIITLIYVKILHYNYLGFVQGQKDQYLSLFCVSAHNILVHARWQLKTLVWRLKIMKNCIFTFI